MKIKFQILFVISFLNISYSNKFEFKNLIFEGAGIRGIAYCGVLIDLEKRNILENIRRVGGTSAGAIHALLVSFGYNAKEINEIIYNTKFKNCKRF